MGWIFAKNINGLPVKMLGATELSLEFANKCVSMYVQDIFFA